MARLDALHHLLTCLGGEIPARPSWPGIIALANKTLCTPIVAARLKDAGNFAALSPDLQMFLDEMASRNEQRNNRLLAQLDEAATAMNLGGVYPVLLKGAAWLVRTPLPQQGRRMLADLDLLVAPAHFFTTIERLSDIGYRLESPSPCPEVPTVLFRAQDAATIDLHTGYGSVATLLYRFDDLSQGAVLTRLTHGSVLLPSPVACVAILLLHDQLKGRDYLRGRIDLRHLLDIQDLGKEFGDAQWAELAQLFAAPYALQAMRTQLLTARKLLGMVVPDGLAHGVRARLQYRRRLIQLRWPSLAPVLTLLSMLDPAYLSARRAFRWAERANMAGEGSLPRRESLWRLLARNELGKV